MLEMIPRKAVPSSNTLEITEDPRKPSPSKGPMSGQPVQQTEVVALRRSARLSMVLVIYTCSSFVQDKIQLAGY